MKSRWFYLTGGILLLTGLVGIGFAVNAWADDDDDEEVIPYASLPEAVREAAEAILGGPGDYRAETEIENGARIYEVEGNGTSLEFTESGDLLEVEEEISFAGLPQGVQQRLGQFAGEGAVAYTKIEKIELHFYEIGLEIDGKRHQLRLLATGADVGEDED